MHCKCLQLIYKQTNALLICCFYISQNVYYKDFLELCNSFSKQWLHLPHCKCLHLDDNCNTNKSCRAVAGIQLLVAGIQLLVAGVQLLVVICTTGVLLEWTLLKVVIYIHSVHFNCSLHSDLSLCIIALANAVISFTEILVNNMQKSFINWIELIYEKKRYKEIKKNKT